MGWIVDRLTAQDDQVAVGHQGGMNNVRGRVDRGGGSGGRNRGQTAKDKEGDKGRTQIPKIVPE